MSFAVPTVALGSTIDLMGTTKVGLLNHQYANNKDFEDWARTASFGLYSNDIFAYGRIVDLQLASRTVVDGVTTESVTATGSTIGTNNSTSTISGQYNGSGTSSNSTYVSGDGTYWNPNSEYLGNTLPTTTSETGSEYGNWTETGYISGSSSGSGSVNYTNSLRGSGSGTYSGSANTESFYRMWWSKSNIELVSNQATLVLFSSGFSDQLEGTAIDISGLSCRTEWLRSDDVIVTRAVANMVPTVLVQGLDNRWYPTDRIDGHYIATVNFKAIAVFTNCPTAYSDGLPSAFKEVRFFGLWHIYLNYDYSETNNIISNDNSNTNAINSNITQQTQNQTNQLKDTTGSDGILSVPKNVGNSIYEQVTFTNQIAGISQQLATKVASADASEGGITLPSWEFQGQQIWPQMVVSPWTDIPVDIKSKVRLFNTMIFAILWIRSLWNWIASIFGFEQVDDSGGSFDNMFEDDAVDTHSYYNEWVIAQRYARRRGEE